MPISKAISKKSSGRKGACQLVVKNGEKMHGKFSECVQAPKSKFAPGSFRMVQTGKTWILVGCPVGKWAAKKMAVINGRKVQGRCTAGMKPHKIFVPKGRTTKRRRK